MAYEHYEDASDQFNNDPNDNPEPHDNTYKKDIYIIKINYELKY